MICRLVWLFNYVSGRLVGLLAWEFIDWFGGFTGLLGGWFAGWLVRWLADWLNGLVVC